MPGQMSDEDMMEAILGGTGPRKVTAGMVRRKKKRADTSNSESTSSSDNSNNNGAKAEQKLQTAANAAAPST